MKPHVAYKGKRRHVFPQESWRYGVAILVLLGTLWAFPVWGGERVRVGYTPMDGFFSVDAQGHFHGYGYEYLEEIATAAGWDLEFINVANGQQQGLLRDGYIDLFGPVVHDSVGTAPLLLPQISAGVLSSVLLARSDDERDLLLKQTDSGPTVGFIHPDMQQLYNGERELDAWCAEKGIVLQKVGFHSYNEMLAAFHAGKIDLILTISLRNVAHTRQVANFAIRPFYFALANDRTELLQKLNEAQVAISSVDPRFRVRLLEKYYWLTTESPLKLTAEEKAALASHKYVRAVFLNNLFPLSTAGDDEDFRGISANIFSHITQLTGMRFSFIPASSMGEALDLIRHDKADILCVCDHDYAFTRKHALHMSVPYVSLPLIRVVHRDKDLTKQDTLRVALPQIIAGFPSLQSIIKHTQYKIRYFKSLPECFDAVRDGEVDMTIATMYHANALLTAGRYHTLIQQGVEQQTWDLSLAVSCRLESSLATALSKTISSMSPATINSSITVNLLDELNTDWRDLVFRYPERIALGIVLFFLLCAGVVAYILALKNSSMAHIRKMLYYDTLTHLLTLQKFREDGAKILHENTESEYALLYVNINNFKYINVTYGYKAGDAVLQATADVLRNTVKEGELAGKSSADRFLVLLHMIDRKELTSRIRTLDVALSGIATELKLESQLIFNCGIYICSHMDDISTAVDRAHYARESLPPSAYNGYAFYDEKIMAKLDSEKEIEKCMVAALEKGEFVAYYQPKVDMVTREIIGAEALVRWNDPRKGLVSPGKFIPLFERNGFIVDIDMAIYSQVCSTLRNMLNQGEKPVPVSCNFSRRHFVRNDLPRFLLEIAHKYDVPLSLLELEITESTVAENMEHMLEQLRELKRQGFTIAIDDFGTGYSALGLLPRLHADILKLDKLFIEEQLRSERSRNVIQGLVDIAKKLELSVICEGVETEMQANYLRQAGCRYCQGFLFGRPMPETLFRSLLAKQSSRGE